MSGSIFLAGCKYVIDGSKALDGAVKVVEFIKGNVEGECWVCGEKIKGSQAQLKEHVVKHRVQQCYICGASANHLEIQAHVEAHKIIKCTECDEMVSIFDIFEHVKSHSTQDCPLCDKEIRANLMTAHLQTHRSAVMGICSICSEEVLHEDMAHHMLGHQ